MCTRDSAEPAGSWGQIQVMRIHRTYKLLEGAKADKRSKKPAVLFSAKEVHKLVDVLHDNKILCNKHLIDDKDRPKREAVWDKFYEENNLDKDACQR